MQGKQITNGMRKLPVRLVQQVKVQTQHATFGVISLKNVMQ